jgi:hypothetical protein
MNKDQFIKKLRVLESKVKNLQEDQKALWHIIRSLEDKLKDKND